MKVNLISLGCPKNLVDSEKILGALGAAGISISALPQDSDIIIINTCGFIRPALEETETEIEKALQIADENNKKVYIFGCAVNRFENELRDKYPNLTLVKSADTLVLLNKDDPLKESSGIMTIETNELTLYEKNGVEWFVGKNLGQDKVDNFIGEYLA